MRYVGVAGDEMEASRRISSACESRFEAVRAWEDKVRRGSRGRVILGAPLAVGLGADTLIVRWERVSGQCFDWCLNSRLSPWGSECQCLVAFSASGRLSLPRGTG